MHEVRAYLSKHLGDRTPADDVDLYESGHLNSLFAVQIVLWVEQNYNLAIGGEDLVMGNFRSIAAIAKFIDGRIAA